MKRILKYLLIAISLWIVISCEKDSSPDGRFIGSWKTLTSDNDTIVFIDESNFTRKYLDGINHSFDYSYDKDSITIQYAGPNEILVPPS